LVELNTNGSPVSAVEQGSSAVWNETEIVSVAPTVLNVEIWPAAVPSMLVSVLVSQSGSPVWQVVVTVGLVAVFVRVITIESELGVSAMSPEKAPVIVLGPSFKRSARTVIDIGHGSDVSRHLRPGLTVPSREFVVAFLKVTPPDGVTKMPGYTVAVIFTDPPGPTVIVDAVSTVWVSVSAEAA
jgi:hypothetical protein